MANSQAVQSVQWRGFNPLKWGFGRLTTFDSHMKSDLEGDLYITRREDITSHWYAMGPIWIRQEEP